MPRKRKAKSQQRAVHRKLLKRTRALDRLRPKKVSKPRKKATPRPKTDLALNVAMREMNRGKSMTAAAHSTHVSVKRLRDFLAKSRLGKRKGKRWVAKDNRLRRVPVMTGGRVRVLIVRGYEPARLVGEHHHAAGEFVRTNDIKRIQPFSGRSVKAVTGRQYVLETDPNALHRIAAMDSPPFHEIYEITSNT